MANAATETTARRTASSLAQVRRRRVIGACSATGPVAAAMGGYPLARGALSAACGRTEGIINMCRGTRVCKEWRDWHSRCNCVTPGTGAASRKTEDRYAGDERRKARDGTTSERHSERSEESPVERGHPERSEGSLRRPEIPRLRSE